MNLAEIFSQPGFGVMATAAADGKVNRAIYARPHIVDESTLVWGMTDRRTFRNLSENRSASYLFKTALPGYSGCRLSLEMIQSREDGEMLTTIRENADVIVGPGAGAAVTHAVWLKVIEIRPLV